jgi:predicted nucleic acid-binding Zn ribbon protein
MAFTTIGDALQSFLKSAKWQSRIDEIRLKEKWEEIMGRTIAKYTREVQLKDGVLYISTDVAPLKQELQIGKAQIIKNINDYFKSEMVKTVVLR